MGNPLKLSADLYDTDTTTLVTALDGAFGMGFIDGYNGFGSGNCSIAMNDSDRAACTRGRFIAIKVGGVRRFTFRIDAKRTATARRPKTGNVLVMTGDGWGCVWNNGIVDVDVPAGADLDPSTRNWSWASPNFPNAGGWGAPTELYEYKDGVAYGARVLKVQSATDEITDEPIYDLVPAPLAFPWPWAPHNGDGFSPTPTYVPTYWTIADGSTETAIGWHFFRGGFGLAGTQLTKFTVTADNLFDFHLHGIPALSEEADLLMWTGWKEISLELPAAFWLVGMMVENVYVPDLTSNPAGLLFAAIAMAIWPDEVEMSEGIGLLLSNAADWVSYFATTLEEWPGYTPGQILQEFIAECQARGEMTQHAGETFTDFTDSNGGDWDSADPDTEMEFVPWFAMKQGETGGKLLEQLHQEGWIDWHFKPDTLTLECWAQGSGGVSSGVSFVEGVNIGEDGMERGPTRVYANRLKVQWAKGFVWVDDLAAQASFGAVVADTLSTEAGIAEDAERQGRIELARAARDADVAIRIAIEPAGSGDTPYVGFEVGDYVTVPTDDGGTEEVQVLSIGCNTDEKGYAIWSLECGHPWLSLDQAQGKLLRSIGGKSMGTLGDLGVTKI